MAFRVDFEAVILGTLQAGKLHGYGIARMVSRLSEGSITIGEGQLYPALQRLEDLGFVESEWEAQVGKPNRRLYRLTEAGSKELRRRQARWGRFASAVESMLMMEPPLTSPVGTRER